MDIIVCALDTASVLCTVQYAYIAVKRKKREAHLHSERKEEGKKGLY